MAAGGGPTAFDNVFQQFAKHGDPKSKGDEITLANIDKWLKQANVMGKKITNTDTSTAFKNIAKAKITLTEKEFMEFLDIVTKGKGLTAKELQDTLAASGPPTSSPTHTTESKPGEKAVEKNGQGTSSDDADIMEALAREAAALMPCSTCCDNGGAY